MKLTLLLAGCLLSCLLSAQFTPGQSVEYTYDNAGNRILREPWQNQGPGPGSKVLQDDLIEQANRYNANLKKVHNEDELGRIHVWVYPNPTSSFLKVKFVGLANESETRTLILYSPAGAMLFKKELATEQHLYELDLSPYSSGLYLIEIRIGEGSKRYSVIKE